jgi:Lrp/AsnC family leucine-responsive transcriptional regulator
MHLDKTDKKILDILQTKGRDTASHIAEAIGMSVPAVAERIRKLQESNIILGYQAVVNPRKVGLDVGALITVVSESSEHYNEVIENVKKSNEITQCFTTTGNGSHILIARTKNTHTLEQLLRQVQSWPGVIRTETQLILSSYKDMNTIDIDLETKVN